MASQEETLTEIDWKIEAEILANSLRLTQEYVGNGLLPPKSGWSWFEALERYNFVLQNEDNKTHERENEPLTKLPRVFVLNRLVDDTGISGTGIVAWGVEFPDGVCAVRWTGQWPTSVVFHDQGMEAIKAVHGHGGKTDVIYIDEETDRNARAYGFEIGRGHPLASVVGKISEDNPFQDKDWKKNVVTEEVTDE